MAAGKNAVSSILVQHGWYAADADDLVHEAVSRAAPQIISAFAGDAAQKGVTLAKPDGTLDRRALGSVIFCDRKLLARQESIVYPEVNRLMDEFIAAHDGKNIVINATVLYKIPVLMNRCSAVFYVYAPYLLRFFRAYSRDGMPFRQIRARFRSQRRLYRFYRETGIPVVKICNAGSLKLLEKRTAAALAENHLI
jgi:dephospho-CoA kinase